MKRYSTGLFIEGMQIKTSVGYHFTPARVAVIKKAHNQKYWKRCGEIGIPSVCGWNVKQRSHFGKQFNGSLKRKDRHTIGLRDSIPRRLFKRN